MSLTQAEGHVTASSKVIKQKTHIKTLVSGNTFLDVVAFLAHILMIWLVGQSVHTSCHHIVNCAAVIFVVNVQMLCVCGFNLCLLFSKTIQSYLAKAPILIHSQIKLLASVCCSLFEINVGHRLMPNNGCRSLNEAGLVNLKDQKCLFYISCLFRCLRQRGRVWGAGQCEFYTFLFSRTWDNAMWTHHIFPFLPLVSLLMGANLNVLQIMSLDDDDDASAVVNQCSG